jgi:hypothetical protein
MAVEPGPPINPSVASVRGAGANSTSVTPSYGLAPAPAPLDATGGDNPMGVLISGVLLLGAIALFIGWGLTHAYSTS